MLPCYLHFRSEDAIPSRLALRRHLPVALVAGLVLLGARLAASYSVAPPLASTGAPGEPSSVQCIHCHADYPLNAGSSAGGSFLLNTPSDSFVTGGSYTLTLAISQPGQQRWGFEVVARTPDGANAGNFAPLDTTVGIQRDFSSQAGLVYAYQILSGTFSGQSSATWHVTWLAPTDPSQTHVTFYATAVAADGVGDSEPQYDYVYQNVWDVQLGTTATRPTTWGRLKALYLNSDAARAPSWRSAARPPTCPAIASRTAF